MEDKVCIICREEMSYVERDPAVAAAAAAANSADGTVPPAPPPRRRQPREGDRPKKLSCNHVFHLSCLKSWLERQQNCPTWYVSDRALLPPVSTLYTESVNLFQPAHRTSAHPERDRHESGDPWHRWACPWCSRSAWRTSRPTLCLPQRQSWTRCRSCRCQCYVGRSRKRRRCSSWRCWWRWWWCW